MNDINFIGKGLPLNNAGLEETGRVLGINRATIWAVLTVETRGCGFLHDRRPQILFERHVFHRITNGEYDTGNEEISHSLPGGYLGGTNEYSRLEKAMRLNQEAALKSTSWGIAQIMGFNFTAAGYATVDAMVRGFINDENKQLQGMANFINANNLANALVNADWRTFARGYNGSNYEKNQYATRLAAAYAKAQTAPPNLALRTAQIALWYLGINPGPIDGLRGRRTTSALIQFQTTRHLPTTGELDQATESALLAAAFPTD